MSKETLNEFKTRLCNAIEQATLGNPLKDFLDDRDIMYGLSLAVSYITEERKQNQRNAAIDNLRHQEFYTKPEYDRRGTGVL
jgi:2-oxo-4-hydroxy-4-carboxy--5-ureidoimidazoline (OHCU) decarboxylase